MGATESRHIGNFSCSLGMKRSGMGLRLFSFFLISPSFTWCHRALPEGRYFVKNLGLPLFFAASLKGSEQMVHQELRRRRQRRPTSDA
jgi:hypothetical protein